MVSTDLGESVQQRSTEYRVAFTSYDGEEDHVLRLRNLTRETIQDRSYLDWRYRSPPGQPKPIIAWVLDARGGRVGMAGLIFRPYWIDGALAAVAVLGDIALNEDLR